MIKFKHYEVQVCALWICLMDMETIIRPAHAHMSVQIWPCGYGSNDMEGSPSWQFDMPNGLNPVDNHLEGISVGRMISYTI